MTRKMYDSVTAANCPADGDLYLGYVDGAWPSYNALVSLHPNAIHVTCTVNGQHAAVVGDCENGDLTPASLVAWVKWMRSLDRDPTGYCSFGSWQACKNAFAAAAEPEPHWLIAGYANPPDPTIPAGAIGHQYADVGPYDVSSVADYWPGVDATPSTDIEEDIPMAAFTNDNDARSFVVRSVFNRELGREPTAAEQAARVAELAAGQGDVMLGQIRDSAEATAFRAKRGW